MTSLALGATVFCYRKNSANSLQPEVGMVVGLAAAKDPAADLVPTILGWTQHGSTFLLEGPPVQSAYKDGSEADFVSGTLLKTRAAVAAEKAAAEAKAKSAPAPAPTSGSGAGGTSASAPAKTPISGTRS